MNFATKVIALIAALGGFVGSAFGHGFAGERFFPPTITTDDPFAADELAFPTVSYFKNPAGDGAPASREIDGSFEFDKLIVPHLSLGVSEGYSWIHPTGESHQNGFQNLSLNVKYELLVDGPHEFIVSVGVEADVGGTGSKSIDRDSFSTFTPTVYFGKGFGDLPKSLEWMKPVAVTGTVGQEFPTSAGAPNALDWGVAVEYQISYLRQHVAALNWPAPFKDMIPLVEISGSTTENRGPSTTTGTVNPGVLFEMKYFQVGVEALIPMNRDSGENVGAVIQVWWFLDDIEPKLFGKPLFFGE
ncbi:MAG TPA: hypothetical protein VM008_08680 [Phycisphaerae bacterium]|nr:hypothetical protein [Phycisphaerae bacterium]